MVKIISPRIHRYLVQIVWIELCIAKYLWGCSTQNLQRSRDNVVVRAECDPDFANVERNRAEPLAGVGF